MKHQAIRDKHWEADMEFVHDYFDSLSGLAKEGFSKAGKGIVVYLESVDVAGYTTAAHFDKQDRDTADERRMLATYNPKREFILCIVHTDATLSLYRFLNRLTYPNLN